MTTRRTVNTRWNHRPEPTPEPESDAMQKAKHLPMFGPGLVITVPLHLLPEYLELYGLTPLPREAAIGEMPNQILKVKRVPREDK